MCGARRSSSESASPCIKMWRRALYFMVSSQEVKVENGLRQGCPLSPLLYSIYVMGMVEKLEEESLGVKEGDYWCGALLYADDVVLLARISG